MASGLCVQTGLPSVGQDPVNSPSAQVLTQPQASGSRPKRLAAMARLRRTVIGALTTAHETRLRVGIGTLWRTSYVGDSRIAT